MVSVVWQNDVGLVAWTVNDPDSAGRLAALGVHRITTDAVADLLSWRDSQG